MNLKLLKQLLTVPTVSNHEQLMVDWLVHYARHVLKGATVTTDHARNVYITKGAATHFPCVAAHLDTVQPLRQVRIVEDNLRGFHRLIGRDVDDRQCGIGADDKAGISVCLELLQRAANIKAVFFAGEEIGMLGARKADPAFFRDVGYLIEYDCPSRNMLSYTNSGVRLFDNGGDFIQTAYPVLMKHGTNLWQHHPYTDVMTLRRRFPISCLNLSCGYYNWHAQDEFIAVNDVKLAIAQGHALLKALGTEDYFCAVGGTDDIKPPCAITPLRVPEPA